MPNLNPFAQSGLTLFAPTAFVATGTSSGLAIGTSQVGRAVRQTSHEVKTGQRDSLLKALNFLLQSEHQPKADLPGEDLIPEELVRMIEVIQSMAISAVNHTVIVPVSISSQASQLPLDVTAALNGLLHSINDYHDFIRTNEASTLDADKELNPHKSNFFADCQEMCMHSSSICRELEKNIEAHFEGDGKAEATHARIANTSGLLSAGGTISSALVVSGIVDSLGSVFREVSGLVASSRGQIMPEEKMVYDAWTACCQAFSHTENPMACLQALKKLEAAILNIKPASKASGNLSLTTPSVSVALRIMTSEPFVKSLIAFNASSLGFMLSHMALQQEQEQSTKNTRNSPADASLVRDFSGGDAVEHSHNVSEFCALFDNAIQHIDEKLAEAGGNQMVGSSAKSTVRSNSALVIAASLIPGFTGLLMREVSGSVDFTQQDKGSRAESSAVLKSRSDRTGADLDNLMSRVCALHDRVQRCQELGVSAPVVLGVGEAITSGSLIGALNMIAGMCFALKECHTLSQSPSQALQLNDAEQQKAKDWEQSVRDSNKASGGSTGNAAVSERLSLNQQLQSVMERVVLCQRASGNFLNHAPERQDINSVGKASIALTQGNTAGFSLGSFGIISLIALQSGIGTEALFAALRNSTMAKRVSDGVDRIESDNGSKTNSHFLSNATRLSEQSMGSSTAIQLASRATYLGAESVFSRSLTVALCQSGALKAMLHRLIAEEEAKLDDNPAFLPSARVSDALSGHKLRDEILKALDAAEVNHNPIPGLNADMASELGLVSNASIATALSTYATFISPVVKSIVILRKASVTDDKMKNEALSGPALSQMISRTMNIIQACTKNAALEAEKIENPLKNPVANCAEDMNCTALVASTCVTLLCDELMEIAVSRSLTLLRKDEVTKASQETRNESKKDSQISTDGVAEDSRCGEPSVASHAITALRLTLTELGIALGNFAENMDDSLRPSRVDNDLELHTSQKYLLQTASYVFACCSNTILTLSANLLKLPLSSIGSVEALRECVHSTDHRIALKPMHSSEHSSKECNSEISLLTGIGTDCVSSILCAVAKLLLQSSVLGLDSALAISKIMEILSIHPNPGEALRLETQAVSEPNGLGRNLSIQTRKPVVISTLGTVSAVATSNIGTSMSIADFQLCLQHAIDEQIEAVGILTDEEETEQVLGLKEFYELLTQLICKKSNPIETKDLVRRLDRGGIALSSYHSAHGVSSTQLVGEVQKTLKCDDAQSLLELFIRKACTHDIGGEDCLITKLKAQLDNRELSSAARETWEHIVNRVFSHAGQRRVRTRARYPEDTEKAVTLLDLKRSMLALSPVAEKAEETEAAEEAEASGSLSAT